MCLGTPFRGECTPKRSMRKNEVSQKRHSSVFSGVLPFRVLFVLLLLGRNPKYPCFGGVSPFQKSAPKTISASKMPIDTLQNINWGGEFLHNSTQRLQIGGHQSLFGCCQFTFWRLKLSWGCSIEKGRPPKSRGAFWVPTTLRVSP